MRNNIKKAFVAALFFSASALVACGGKSGDTKSSEPAKTSEAATSEVVATSSETKTSSEAPATSEVVSTSSEVKTSSKVDVYYTVTFETNGGSAVASQSVLEGSYATAPADPTKDGFDFDGWYKEASLTTKFVFASEAITKDTTIYAGWVENDPTSTTYTGTFYWNYEGAPNNGIYETKTVDKGSKLSKPSTDPVRAGFNFNGWFMEPECVTEFARSQFDRNVKVYASWLKTYTFEAEDCQLEGFDLDAVDDTVYETLDDFGKKIGHGISSDFTGKGCVGNDPAASNSRAIHGFYYKGACLDFEINSDCDTTGSLALRLSAEFRVVKLTTDTFQVLVNGNKTSYKTGDIEITPIEKNGSYAGDGYWDTAESHSYQDYVINTVNLKKGENLVRLYVNNSVSLGVGTCNAYAPIIDAMKITTGASLTMKTYSNY